MIRIIPGKHLGAFGLMPAAPGTCPECAVDHPHKFYNDHGRWPTWEDAMSHCSEDMKTIWREELRKRGVEI